MQELTGRNFITLADLEFLNPTPRLSSELDQVACLQGADGVDTLSEFSQLGGDGLHLRRRRLRRFALAGTDRDQSREGEKKSLRMTHGKGAFAGLCRVPDGLTAKVCRSENRHAENVRYVPAQALIENLRDTGVSPMDCWLRTSSLFTVSNNGGGWPLWPIACARERWRNLKGRVGSWPTDGSFAVPSRPIGSAT